MAGLNATLKIAGVEVTNAVETPIANHRSLFCRWIVGPDENFV